MFANNFTGMNFLRRAELAVVAFVNLKMFSLIPVFNFYLLIICLNINFFVFALLSRYSVVLSVDGLCLS